MDDEKAVVEGDRVAFLGVTAPMEMLDEEGYVCVAFNPPPTDV